MWKVVEIATFAVLFLAVSAFPGRNEQKSPRDLRHDIFENYDPTIIPVKKAGDIIVLNASLSVLAINELNEKEETLVLDSWLSMSWDDQYLTWDPSAYGGIKSFNIPATEVWRPDLTLYTSTPVVRLFPEVFTNVIINNTGQVMWVPPMLINSRCPLDLSDYPHDIQTCSVKLGSWTYSVASGIDLQLQYDFADFSYFIDNNQQWSMVNATVERNDGYYPCCPGENYPSIRYNITIKRRTPSEIRISDAVSAFAVFISLLMFWLPPDTSLKVLIGVLAEVLLSLDIMYLGQTIASPLVLEKATERVYPFMCVVAAALILEILVSYLARAMVPCKPPAFLLSLAKGFCQLFCVCASRPSSGGGDLLPEVEPTDKGKTPIYSLQEEWNLVATALDRVLFILYLIVSVFFCYFSLH